MCLKSKAINEADYGVIFSPGIEISLSKDVSTFVEFNYLIGLQNLEKDGDQEIKKYCLWLTLGLSFSLVNNVKQKKYRNMKKLIFYGLLSWQV